MNLMRYDININCQLSVLGGAAASKPAATAQAQRVSFTFFIWRSGHCQEKKNSNGIHWIFIGKMMISGNVRRK